MKNSKLFQYIVIGSFIFFTIVGAILFSTYRSADKNNTNISITMWGTLSSGTFAPFASRYFSENQLKYNIRYVEKDPFTFDQDLIEALASGSGPDAIILPSDMIVRYSNKIYPIPYAVLPELTFKQTFIQEGEIYLNKDGVLALPITIDPLVMYWNRDIFNNAGVTIPPLVWTDISNLVSKMTQKDQAKNILASTVALGEFRNVTNAKEILSALIMQVVAQTKAINSIKTGDPIITMSTDGTLRSSLKDNFGSAVSPAALALGFFTNFSNPVKVDYSWNRSLPNSLDSFTNGDLAIYFGFASEYSKIKNKNPNLNFDVAPLPQIAKAKVKNTFGKMLGFAIMKNSSNPAGAYTVLNTLTSAKAFSYLANTVNIPSARRDVLGQNEPNPTKKIFNDSAIMSSGWLDPNSAQANTIFQEMVESYTTGRESLDSVITTASDRLDNLLINK